jgi:murein L,D-transpeptidase YcbB/YkuD
MRDALADYRAIVEGGGWPKLDVAAPLARDSAGDAVAVLRRRLFLEGDLPATADTASPRFDATLEDAVRRFQQRHGLNADGVIGKRTLAELNVSAGRRVAQLRANLERARWVLRDLSDTLLAVNVAGQLAYLLVGDGVAWSSRVVVGEEYTRTPVFAASMKEVVLNPDWTVPRTINGEILASAEEDPDYLRREGFEVIDESGRALDPDELDLGGYTGETFPHTFVQRPGPTNALGRIKFMFPNRFDVYLHDTPARGLFAREDRTFSHGCIRVEDPLSLGETVLSGWPRERLEAVLREGDTRTVELDAPLPVLILYWTAATDLDGEVHFYRDIYGRDGPLIEALARPSPS